MEAPIFTFSEQKRCSYFPEVPSLHLTKFLFHVLSNSRTRTVGARSHSGVSVAALHPGRDDCSITVRNRICMTSFAGMLMMVLLLLEPGSKPIFLAWTAGAWHL